MTRQWSDVYPPESTKCKRSVSQENRHPNVLISYWAIDFDMTASLGNTESWAGIWSNHFWKAAIVHNTKVSLTSIREINWPQACRWDTWLCSSPPSQTWSARSPSVCRASRPVEGPYSRTIHPVELLSDFDGPIERDAPKSLLLNIYNHTRRKNWCFRN